MYDVVIIGYGPTGMMAAILLGRQGRKVAVLERYPSLYNLPRVGMVHDDILRMFQEIGCLEKILPSTFFLASFELANKGRVLLSNDVSPFATHGHPEFTSIHQPAFEAELDVAAKALPSVDVFQGERVVALAQDAHGVTVTAETAGGARREVRGRYAIGADGGNSFVRETLGIRYEDLGFDQDWLVVDGRLKHPERPGLPPLRQFCEPEQPGVTLRMGPDIRRWSFMIFPGESPEDAMRPEAAWRRLDRPEGGTPDDYELIRVASYRFQSLLAHPWRKGRVFLAGDAAHQMPPFLAQGLCSGFRDAHNLAWKLGLVLDGRASEAILDTYEQERGPNARATIVESMRVGQTVNERDPAKVKARDEQLLALQAAKQNGTAPKQLIAFRVPGFTQGVIASNGAAAAGDAFPQNRVARNGVTGLFDDVAGRGFLLVVRGNDPEAALLPADREFWRSLGGRTVRLGVDVIDSEGRYGQLMDEYGCDVLVKRPDYYLFGACKSAGELPALLADLRRQLG